jgi:hypothetical protein
MRYEMLAGKKAAPISPLFEFIVLIIQTGSEGSMTAMPMLANVIEPAAMSIYGSLTKFFKDVPSCFSLCTPGFKTSN